MGNMMQGSSFGSMLLAASLAALGPSAASAEEWTLTTLHSFQGGFDGVFPNGGLVADASGALYGTTAGGGEEWPYLYGTVFKLTPPSAGSSDWTEQVLLHLPGGASGDGPSGGVIFGPAGSLYGLTIAGGTKESGVAYRLYPPAPSIERWHPSLLYSFVNGDKLRGLLLRGPGNVLYGTAEGRGGTGDTYNYGSVFALVPSKIAGGGWSLSYLHVFTDKDGDGAAPMTGVITDASGALYGVTPGGGNGNGIVFKLTPPTTAGGSWTETVLHTFIGQESKEDEDGSQPGGLVMDKSGSLYGTTSEGGSHNDGVIYRLTPTTTEDSAWGYSILHDFSGPDGANPDSALILGATGDLYGTTTEGGNSSSGTIFRLTPPANSGGSWTLTVLHAFNGLDGSDPQGPLLLLHGALYGTTQIGGADPGVGTVFKLTAPP